MEGSQAGEHATPELDVISKVLIIQDATAQGDLGTATTACRPLLVFVKQAL